MPRRVPTPEPKMAVLTAAQMERGVARLEKLIKEIQGFDTQIIQSAGDQRSKR